jgi:excisionase family DNA binding protein
MSPSGTTLGGSVLSPSGEQEQLAAVKEAFAAEPGPVTLTFPGGKTVDVPPSLLTAYHHVAAIMARGDGIALTPFARELSTTQAARMLGMSRPTLIRLIDAGELPSRMVGTHRRVAATDVLDYGRKRADERVQSYMEHMRWADEQGFVQG